MPETPRTWTLAQDNNWRPPVLFAEGPELAEGEKQKVYEAGPVDAERERLLDLVERLTANLAAVESQRSWGKPSEAVIEANAFLRKYDRLGKEES